MTGGNSSTLVSVLITTCDRPDSLGRTLAAVGKAELPAGLRCEVLVIDNGENAKTERVVEASRLPMRLRYLRERRRGQSWARNLGMAEAEGDIIVFTDDDVIPPPDWLARVCEPILAGRAEAVAGGIRLAPHLDRTWMTGSQRAWLAGTESLGTSEPSRMVGANMAFSRAVLEKVPAFDPELGPGALGYGDDTLFSIQLRKAGYRIEGVFDGPVEHHFDAKRLEREGWMDAAERLGRVDAYMAHHWEHASWGRPRWNVLKATLRLWQYRLFHLRSLAKSAETPEDLINATRYLHARIQYMQECRRPRNYAKGGLVKLCGVDSKPAYRPVADERAPVERITFTEDISIIIPAWNAARFLPATLESIRAQTFADWECIIVDDGSRDDTAAVAQSFAEADDRFRVIRQKNGGASSARNRGWAESDPQSGYIIFMDSDNVWMPDALELLRAELKEHPEAPAVHGLAEFIDSDGNPKDAGVFSAYGRDRQGFVKNRIVPWPLTKPTAFEMLLWENTIYPPGLLLARRRFLGEAAPFAVEISLIEDWAYVQRLSRSGDIRFLDRVLLHYRRHDANCSGADNAANRDAVRMMHHRTFFSEEHSETQRVLAKKSWRAWQLFLFRAMWRNAKKEFGTGRVVEAFKAIVQMVIQIYRYARGYPTRTGI